MGRFGGVLFVLFFSLFVCWRICSQKPITLYLALAYVIFILRNYSILG